MTDPLAEALMYENADLWVPGTPVAPVSPDLNSRLSIAGARLTDRLQGGVDSLVSALMAPGNALQGHYDQRPIYADGSVGQFDTRMERDALELAGAVALGAMPMPRPSNSLGMFGGVRAQTADRAALARAQDMEASGAPRDAIWNDTGWFKGADGQWRFEIDDSAASAGRNVLADDGREVYRGQLGQALTHPGLYAAYPGAAQIPVATHWRAPNSYLASEGISLGTNVAENRSLLSRNSRLDGLPNATNPQYARAGDIGTDPSVVLHEAQHAIQAQEGFTRGGNPEQFADIMPDPQAISDARVMASLVRKGVPIEEAPQAFLNMVGRDVAPEARELIRDMDALNAMPSDPMEAYKRLAGEVEARNVQTRMDMTPEQRRAQPPWATQDVPDNLQIIRMLAGT